MKDRYFSYYSLFYLLLVMVFIVGCTPISNSNDQTNEKTNAESDNEKISNENDQNMMEEKNATKESIKNRIAIVETNKGTFKFELFEDKAPITAKNFIDLTNSGFYNGLTWHRYEPNFVIQGGDPDGDGTGGSNTTIPLEVRKDLQHDKGVVGMARSADPNSATSQFYVTLDAVHFLDNNYAVFGSVTEGMDVVLQLRAGDVMKNVTITS